jgi:hypothetical protein
VRIFHYCHLSDPLPRKYLSDPAEDVRVATEVVLSEFLKEIRDITVVARKTHSEQPVKQEVAIEETEPSDQNQGDTTPIHSEEEDGDALSPDDSNTDLDDRDLGCQRFSHFFCNHLTCGT